MKQININLRKDNASNPSEQEAPGARHVGGARALPAGGALALPGLCLAQIF